MILGLDTSNYTTSVSVVDTDKNIIFDERIILDVKEGNRGLRQSEAVYEHVRNLPLITSKLDRYSIDAVCVSVTPRNVEGSFMPCFLVGKNFGKAFSDIMHIPYFETSHQEGHIASAKYGNDIEEDRFIFVHMSGGTTEILVCQKTDCGYDSKIIGGTTDISAGQFVDRTGVLIGMKFPAGAEMDRVYEENKDYTLPTSVKGTYMSFSGVETKIASLIKSGDITVSAAVSAVFRCVGRSIGRAVENAAKEYDINNILIGGGVASSENIRDLIQREVSVRRKIFYAKGRLSSDNAVGVAIIGCGMYGGMNG